MTDLHDVVESLDVVVLEPVVDAALQRFDLFRRNGLERRNTSMFQTIFHEPLNSHCTKMLNKESKFRPTLIELGSQTETD
jgi:hypothetical protein